MPRKDIFAHGQKEQRHLYDTGRKQLGRNQEIGNVVNIQVISINRIDYVCPPRACMRMCFGRTTSRAIPTISSIRIAT